MRVAGSAGDDGDRSMKKEHIKHGVETWWDKIHDGLGRLRQSAASALTHYRPGTQTQLPASADIDPPFAIANPAWALIGGDVYEDERRVVVRLEVPGMERDDFDLQVHGDTLVVRGEKRFERESTEGRWRSVQCAYGSFHRTVQLPAAVQPDAARAVYRNGVLKIELPKAQSARPRS